MFFIINFTINAQDLNIPKLGDGIIDLVGKDSTWAMNIGMLMQFQSYAQWEQHRQSSSHLESNMRIRRARLKFDGFVHSPKLTYKLILGFSNMDMKGASTYTSHAPRYIMEAIVKWNFYKEFSLWFGQAKLPGNRGELISSANLQFVERSLLNNTFKIDRDLGIQLRHKFRLTDKFMVKEALAISQGEGRNITSGNLGGLQYTTRLELFPFGDFLNHGAYIGGDIYREPTPKLALGASYDFNNNAVKTRSNQGNYMIIDRGYHKTNISTVFVDMMYKYRGFSFMAEYSSRTAQDKIAKNTDGTPTGDEVEVGSGWNFQSGYLFENNWEISGRFSNVELGKNNFGKISQNQYTLGLSKYIVNHKLKLQTDIGYLTQNPTNDQLLWRLQFEVQF